MNASAEGALIHYEVEPNYAGWTLAAYVAEKLKRPLPPDRLDRLLRGRALVHTEAELLPHTKIWPGLRFSLRKRSPGDSGEPPHVPVIYEDEALLVVDKPAGLAVHPTARYHMTTLTWALEQRHRNARGEKPDPAHRLDRETSGLLACGRSSLHSRRLKAARAAGHVRRADHRRGAPPAAPLAPGAARERAELAAPGERGADAIRVATARGHRGAAREFQADLERLCRLLLEAEPVMAPRKNATTPARPSASCRRGSNPSSARALEMSADDSRRSPGRGAWNSISTRAADSPITCLSVAIRSSRDELRPLATLITSPGAFSLTAASRFARTTSSTWTKSRVCSPSPNTMGRCPGRSRVVKRWLMAAYPLFGSCRGH